jgi:ATP-binding cassette, subfamily B, multidrug efflux pump
MLIRLLREHLRPYGRGLLGVAVFQLLSTIALLYLPTFNADIIDLGIVKGDTGSYGLTLVKPP